MDGLTLFREYLETPVGRLLIVADGRGVLRALDFEERESILAAGLRRHYGAARVAPAAAASAARDWLEAYFGGALSALDQIETAAAGTAFQRAVWDALRRIPAGETVSYGALAAAIGRPNAIRAVGSALRANPIAIVAPCHRVIGADKSLTGYAGGLPRKLWLLGHEGALPGTAGVVAA